MGTEVPALVGRGEERSLLEGLVASAAGGAGGLLVIEGEAGLGKSRLLEEAIALAADQGMKVHEAVTQPLQTDVPLGLVSELLAGAGQDLPRASASDPASAVHLAREQVIETIEADAALGPVVLAFDDVQWADPASMSVLAALAHRCARLPVAMIVAIRPEPRIPALAQLLDRSPALVRVRLRPLDAGSVHQLAEEVLGLPPASRLRDHLAGAAGNPFLVVEAIRALEQDDLVERRADIAEIAVGRLPTGSLRTVLLDRIGALGEGTLDLLEAGAVLGGTFTLDEAAGVLGRDPATLVEPARRAVRAGLLDHVESEGLGFHHDLVREALYDEVPVPARDQLHRAAAGTLSGSGANGVRVGQHAALGVQAGDHQSARWLLDAAAVAGTYDADAALGLLDRAAIAAEDDTALTSEVAAARVTALVWSGRAEEAEVEVEAALATEGLAAADEARFEHRLGEVLLVRGDAAAAVPLLRRALDAEVLDEPEVLRAGAWLAAALLSSYDVAGAIAVADATIERADAGDGDDEALANALATRCRLRAFHLDLDDALADADRALAVARAGPPVLRRTPHLLCGHTLATADQLDAALQVLREGIAHAERHGQLSALPRLHSAVVSVAMDAGHWDEASTEGALLLALGEETGVRAGRFEALGWLAQMAFHRGDQVVQDELLAACADERATPGHDAGGITVSLWAEALAAEAAGDPATGARLMGDCFDLAVGLDVRMAQLSYGPDLARMAVAAGDRERARQVAAAVAPLASRAGVAGARGHALTCRGLADGSSDRLLEAADAFADAGRPLPQAQAVDAAAQLLASRGADAKAAAARTDAVATYRRIGALRHVRRLEAQEGVSLTAERPATGWGSLTPTEATVAHLVAEGLTNAQIAERQGTSRRTVETHVSRLYRKLEVPNRVVLAAATQEHRATSR